jgi:CspA family cold shock protein
VAKRRNRIRVTTPASPGKVTLFNTKEGWGVIETPDVDAEVWVHFSVIDMPGYRSLRDGQRVQLRWEPGHQDGYRYVATWVAPLPPHDAGS